jgi:hypothetical protein
MICVVVPVPPFAAGMQIKMLNTYKKKQWRPPSQKKKRGKNPKPKE